MSTPLTEKVSFSLTETRLLMLGAEMGIGFQFEVPFQEGFGELPSALQWIHLAALGFMLVTIVLVIAPMMMDLLVFHGQASASTQAMATVVVEGSLGLFALSLALSFVGCAWKTAGPAPAAAIAAVFLILCAAAWYAYPYFRRRRTGSSRLRRRSIFPMKNVQDTPLQVRMRDVLTEARIILPGAQAMLGFQMIAFLTRAFSRLPAASQWTHVAAVALLLITIVLLMAPPAFHRIVEAGEETERLYRFSENMVILSAVPFALSLACDLDVAVRLIVRSSAAGLGAAAALLIFCLMAWYAFPWFVRASRKSKG